MIAKHTNLQQLRAPGQQGNSVQENFSIRKEKAKIAIARIPPQLSKILLHRSYVQSRCDFIIRNTFQVRCFVRRDSIVNLQDEFQNVVNLKLEFQNCITTDKVECRDRKAAGPSPQLDMHH